MVALLERGVTVAVSSPVITAAQTVVQMSESAGNTRDPRMKALAAANAAGIAPVDHVVIRFREDYIASLRAQGRDADAVASGQAP